LIYVGIDPGKKGFVAAVDSHGSVLGFWPQPLIGTDTKGDNFDLQAMRRIMDDLVKLGDVEVLIEELKPMHKGTSSVHFYQGGCFFAWRALCLGMGIRCRLMTKAELKKVMGIRTPQGEKKRPEPGKKATKKEREAWRKANGSRMTRNANKRKAEAIKVAKMLFPDVDFRRTARSKNDDDNKAEALLYAEALRKVSVLSPGDGLAIFG
jgi:hypothetical protein